MNQDTLARLDGILSQNYEVLGDASSENLLEKYRLNSVDALEFLLRVEEEFDIAIPDDQLNTGLLSDMGNLATYIDQLGNERPRG
jgi:acyl carrier protein